MANKKRQQQRETKRKKQQRQRLLTGGLISLVALVAAFFTFNRPTPPITKDLSADELAALSIGPEVGSFAPDFTLTDTTEREVSLSDYRGKPVAMMFFHTW